MSSRKIIVTQEQQFVLDRRTLGLKVERAGSVIAKIPQQKALAILP